MPQQLYRICDEEVGIISVGELIDSLWVDDGIVPSPDSPYFPRGEWYCENYDCTVREVRINEKYLDDAPPAAPPKMRCPRCGRVMKFHGYVKPKIRLVPVS